MGDVIPFPGRHARRDGKPDYPYRMYPLKVKRTGPRTYDPMPNAHWSPEELIRWYLAVLAIESRLTVELRRAHPSTGLYALQLGDRSPITGLTTQRAWDILGGAYEAAIQMEAVDR